MAEHRPKFVVMKAWIGGYVVLDVDACPAEVECEVRSSGLYPSQEAEAFEKAKRMAAMLNREAEMREQIDAATRKEDA